MSDSKSQTAGTPPSGDGENDGVRPIRRRKRDRSSGFAASTLAVPLQTSVRAKVDQLSRHSGLTPGEVVEVLATRALEEQLPAAGTEGDDSSHTIIEVVEALHQTHLQRLEQMGKPPVKQVLSESEGGASGMENPDGA
jgi:hypothetical protein